MTTKEHYTEQLKKDLENIEELKQERKKAWEAGNRDLYRTCTNAIREINEGINAYKVYLDKEGEKTMNELRKYLGNLNLTSGAEEFIASATDEELEELFDIQEIEEEGDFGNAKALFVESVIDAYKD